MHPKRGTTTVGVKCTEGVVLAADKRATGGSSIANKNVLKIAGITDYCAATIAGTVAEAFELVETLKAEAALYAVRTERHLSVKGIANLASELINSRKFYSLPVELLIGGFEGGASLFMVDFFGGLSEESYVASGSGSSNAIGVLRSYLNGKADFGLDYAVEAAVKAVDSAINWDPATGEGVSVAVVNGGGLRFLTPEQVDSYSARGRTS
ncbi:MAG: proteasome subunit beta [Candidatus Marsarchaeota archaeon]|nr:proteasome subunit beta [Candidatus Marsarchaeota archaeon]